MPSNPWHPKLPTSAKARRMLAIYNKICSALVLFQPNGTTRPIEIVACNVPNPCKREQDARFIIGTVAEELCSEMVLAEYYRKQRRSEPVNEFPGKWGVIAEQWRKWKSGKDWQ